MTKTVTKKKVLDKQHAKKGLPKAEYDRTGFEAWCLKQTIKGCDKCSTACPSRSRR